MDWDLQAQRTREEGKCECVEGPSAWVRGGTPFFPGVDSCKTPPSFDTIGKCGSENPKPCLVAELRGADPEATAILPRLEALLLLGGHTAAERAPGVSRLSLENPHLPTRGLLPPLPSGGWLLRAFYDSI